METRLGGEERQRQTDHPPQLVMIVMASPHFCTLNCNPAVSGLRQPVFARSQRFQTGDRVGEKRKDEKKKKKVYTKQKNGASDVDEEAAGFALLGRLASRCGAQRSRVEAGWLPGGGACLDGSCCCCLFSLSPPRFLLDALSLVVSVSFR